VGIIPIVWTKEGDRYRETYNYDLTAGVYYWYIANNAGNYELNLYFSYHLGDVDNDGKLTSADARLSLRQAVKLESFPENSPEFRACDINKDKKVTASDARSILRAAVKLETLKDY